MEKLNLEELNEKIRYKFLYGDIEEWDRESNYADDVGSAMRAAHKLNLFEQYLFFKTEDNKYALCDKFSFPDWSCFIRADSMALAICLAIVDKNTTKTTFR